MVGLLACAPTGQYALLCCALIMLLPSTASEVQGHRFEIWNSPPYGIVPAGSYSVTSLLSCHIRCLSNHNSAYLTYNKDTASCTCAEALSDTIPPPTGSDKLYVHAATSQCDVSSGFNVYLYKNVAVCLLLRPPNKSYFGARSACSQFTNGRLFVSDSADKMQILRNVRDHEGITATFWIGLDDIIEEGVYVWADERVATAEVIAEVFASGQPDNSNNSDCISLGWHGKLMDSRCTDIKNYVCEIPTSV